MSRSESDGKRWRASRRQFGVETLAAVGTSCVASRRLAGQIGVESGAPATGILADYVHARDRSTRFERLAAGELAGGRWQTCRLVSQTWRCFAWMHELALFLPDGLEADATKMLLLIGGGDAKQARNPGAGPGEEMKSLAVAAQAAGMPAASIRQVPYQPMFDGLREDDLIAHTFVEYVRTGDPSWPLLLPMVKAAVEAMTACEAVGRDDWGIEIDGFVVSGASKRGWTTWLTAAVDDRVRGAMPMVIDLLSLERHVALQRESFGHLSEKLVPYTSRGIERLVETPRGRELVGIVDPFAYRERLALPKVIVLGTNDPYWPLESLGLYYDGLPGPCWVSYAPNAGHGLPAARMGGIAVALGRHTADGPALPALDWHFNATSAGQECTVRSDEEPDQVLVWRASAPSRDFRSARWTSSRVDSAAGAWRMEIERPRAGFAAAFVECRYPRRPLPLFLTTGVRVESAG